MKTKAFSALVLAFLVAAGLGVTAWADEPAAPPVVAPTTVPASQPAPERSAIEALAEYKGLDQLNAEEIAGLVKQIEVATTPAAAGAAYAKGCNIDRANVKLQRAYLVRMLELNQAELCYAPAMVLTRAEPGNALAWAAMGYYHAVKNELPAALTAFLQACDNGSTDANVLSDLGQLVAWHEEQSPAPVLPGDGKGLLGKLKPKLTTEPALAKGYNDAKKAYAAIEASRKQAEQKVKDAEKAGTIATKAVRDLENKVASNNRQIDTLRQQIRNLQNDLSNSTTRDRIRTMEDQKAQHERANNVLMQQGRDAQAKANDKLKELGDAKKHLDECAKANFRNFKWLPPRPVSPSGGAATPAA